MATSLQGISEEELQKANVVTAPEIGFIHNSRAQEVRDSSGTLLSDLLSEKLSFSVKFIIAQNTVRQVTLGIFYPEQSAAVCGHALRNYLNGSLDSLALAKQSDLLSYGPNKPISRPEKLSPTQGDVTLIGGGVICRDISRDEASSMTLRDVFDLRSVPYQQMDIVRALVFQKLGVTL